MRETPAVGVLAVAAIAHLSPMAVAQPVEFFCRSAGDLALTDDEPPITSGTMDQFVFIQEGGLDFSGLRIEFTISNRDALPDAFTGTFTFGNDAQDVFAGALSGSRFVDENGDWSGGGDWTSAGGTGAYAGLSGSGQFTFAVLIADQASYSAFNGVIVPAPPVAAAALLLGATASSRRRRP